MADYIEQLKAFSKAQDFFVGIDSDGCAFDTMEVKHKACFYPMVIQYWDAAGVAKYAREVWDYVNLYSTLRGCNRFRALLSTLDLLSEWPEACEAGWIAPGVQSVRDWVAVETKLGNPALEAKLAEAGDEMLQRALAWSAGINRMVADVVHDVPPFPHVRECLQALVGKADVMVVSATPQEALVREWKEHDIDQYVGLICGQEMGSKVEHLKYAAGGKYGADRVLMVGDAPGDMKAAQANGALFYPINPGAEIDSWKRFHDEAMGKFLDGTYAGAYEAKVIAEFEGYLPSSPPWKK